VHLRLDHAISKQRAGEYGSDDDVAVVTPGRDYTYGDLNRRANGLAARLRAAGVERGDRVVAFMHNRIEWFDLVYALAKLRAVLVPANHFLVPSELEYLIADSGARAVLADPELAPRLDFLRGRAEFDGRRLLAEGALDGWDTLDVDALPFDGAIEREEGAGVDEPFIIQYTSGTTGRPKGAVHTQATVLLNLMSQGWDFAVRPSDVVLLVPSLAWVGGMHSFTQTVLMAGGRVVLGPGTAVSAEEVGHALRTQGVSIVALPAVVMRRLLERDDFTGESCPNLRMIVTGGEPVPVDLLEAMGRRLPDCAVMQFYGMTEFPSAGVFLRPESAARKLGSVGKSGVITRLRVVDDDLVDLPTGEIGEIVTRTATSALGYWHREEESREAFGDGWFRTGDVGYLDEDGFLFITSRKKDMIISGGLNVYPAEIEHTILRHEAVEEVAVVGLPDATWGEIPVAVVVLTDAGALDAVRAHADENLSKFKRPKRWVVSAEPLPRTVSGKVQKFRIVERLTMESGARVVDAP
jgi:fatty-acyl-CoA synthase